MARYIAALDEAGQTLEAVGGKGLNLIRLTRAGFRVPPGFVVTTEAYEAYVAANGLVEVIDRATAGLRAPTNGSLAAGSPTASPTGAADAVALDAASATIRATFSAGTLPEDVRAQLLAAAAEYERTPVAVRSSATAEDLPELSFAGQQDTYLNVLGPDQLRRAVVDCWSSLWTARAIGYRLRNAIPHEQVALAVVVQELVPARASGVLFTADPLTGVRSHMVVDAVAGLGESLVSGQVEPDHWVLGPDGQVLQRTLGARTVATVPAEGGGTRTVPAPEAGSGGADAYVLSDEQVAELHELGARIQTEYDSPQDIEWAVADGVLYVLQTRAITSLYPVPAGAPEDSLWFSFGAFQGMLRPITPLGRDALVHLASGGAAVFAGRPSDPERQGFIAVAGERLWARVDGLLRHPLGARVVPTMLSVGEPGTGAIVRRLQDAVDPRVQSRRAHPRTLLPALRFARLVLPALPVSLLAPAIRRRRFDAALEALVTDGARAQAQAGTESDPYRRLARRVEAAETTLGTGLAQAFRRFAPVMGPAMALQVLLQRIGRRAGAEGERLALEVVRSLPGNPTTAMDLALWQVATVVRQDPAALALVEQHGPADLAALYRAGRLPVRTQAAVADFLATYGMRGVAEIDVGAPRWRDEPAQVFATLRSYLAIDPGAAPDVAYAAGIEDSRRAVERLVELLAARGPWPPSGLVWFVASRLRILLGAREVPKFTLVRLLGQIREALLASGQDLVALGRLDRPDDVVFLHLNELRDLANAPHEPSDTEDLRQRVAERRTAFARELRRRQVPRLLAGDGRAWYEGLGEGTTGIIGSPVSPGVAEGRVRVVFDPSTAHLEPGEILVCPGTDPAWTPLFLAAGGLVTEVGGMMTHGSVVAREYGIPAVVGVHEATTRLATGQRIRLDGSTGVVEVLEWPPVITRVGVGAPLSGQVSDPPRTVLPMTGPDPLHLPATEDAAAWLEERRTTLLADVGRQVADLKAAPPTDALETLHRWNDVTLALGGLSATASVYSQVHPHEDVRTLGDQVVQEASQVSTELSLDPELYAVFAALDPEALDDPVARRLLERVLRDFRRSGVDRDEATRTRLRELDRRQVELGQQMSRTIRADVRSIRVTPDRLAGLPEDWIAAHPADEDGLVTVTTDYPDAVPFFTFAHDAAARRELRVEFLNRGWPDNDEVLRELFAVRREVAGLLGYENWPDYASEVMMIGTGDAIPAFVDRIAELALEPGRREVAVLLERMRQDVPGATTIDAADTAYYAELVRREQYDVDAQEVRRYFDFGKVRQGLLDVTGRLFGLAYVPVDPAEARVWHEDVATYDVHRRLPESEGPGERIGRIHLDLHPREGKYKHAAQFTLARGVRGRRLPEGVLVCNFPRGLMQHDDVVTLFHEFGHLVHHVLGGGSEWVRFSGVATEWDFVEAPSQLLEEWAWDPAVLATFATDEAGQPIPADLVARMRRAEDFGKGYQARTQMFYAALAYDLHAAERPDLTARVRELQERYSLFPYIEDTHFHCNFGHLDGYSSGYYTYAWSQVIAKDLFSAFDPDDLFEPGVAARYRDLILARGGEKDAADLVEDFLGRPSTFDAYASWLAR